MTAPGTTFVFVALLAQRILLGAEAASTESCPDFAHETLALAPPTVYSERVLVEAPAWLSTLDHLENSRDDGFAALIGDAAQTRGAVFRIDRAFSPSPAVEAAIRARTRARADACGVSIPLRPLRPGRYAFVYPLEGRDLVGAELLVAPGRDFVELRLRDRGRPLRAVYPVTCARFDIDPPGACAAREASPRDLDTLVLHAPRLPAKAPSPQATERRLRTSVQISWSLAGVGVGGLVVGGLISPRECCSDGVGYLVLLPFSAVLTVASTISGAIYSHRLRAHRRHARSATRLTPTGGGISVRF